MERQIKLIESGEVYFQYKIEDEDLIKEKQLNTGIPLVFQLYDLNDKLLREIKIKKEIGIFEFTKEVFDLYNQSEDKYWYESGNIEIVIDYEKLEYTEFYDLPNEPCKRKGKIILIDDDNAQIVKKGKWTYFDHNGEILIERVYDEGDLGFTIFEGREIKFCSICEITGHSDEECEPFKDFTDEDIPF